MGGCTSSPSGVAPDVPQRAVLGPAGSSSGGSSATSYRVKDRPTSPARGAKRLSRGAEELVLEPSLVLDDSQVP